MYITFINKNGNYIDSIINVNGHGKGDFYDCYDFKLENGVKNTVLDMCSIDDALLIEIDAVYLNEKEKEKKKDNGQYEWFYLGIITDLFSFTVYQVNQELDTLILLQNVHLSELGSSYYGSSLDDVGVLYVDEINTKGELVRDVYIMITYFNNYRDFKYEATFMFNEEKLIGSGVPNINIGKLYICLIFLLFVWHF